MYIYVASKFSQTSASVGRSGHWYNITHRPSLIKALNMPQHYAGYESASTISSRHSFTIPTAHSFRLTATYLSCPLTRVRVYSVYNKPIL